MLNGEIKTALEIIKGNSNPEIHHYHRGSHPGINFYIKTILPGPEILNDDTYPIWQFWRNLSIQHPQLVKIVERAYDWQGDTITGWWTIWLHQRIDICWDYSPRLGVVSDIVDFDLGLNNSGKQSLEWFTILYDRLQDDDSVSYEELEEIANFLQTYTSEHIATFNRANLKVIENDQIHTETSDREQLDT